MRRLSGHLPSTSYAQLTASDGVSIAANILSCAAKRSSLMLWA
jgi:hypothetical protein